MALQTVLMFSERDHPWKLFVEPWLIETDVPAHTVVRIERTVAPEVERDGTEIHVGDPTISVWIFDTTFTVSVGEVLTTYDFSDMAEAISRFPRAQI